MRGKLIKIIKAVALGAVLLGCLFQVGCTSEVICTVSRKNIRFADENTKKEWGRQLAKLLSDVRITNDENAFDEDTEAETVIAQSIGCGLLDVTQDGVPELLVYPYGYYGTSGTATYFIYDIYSGEYLGCINGGNSESWCMYYNIETEELTLVGQYWLRNGWFERNRYIVTAAYDNGVCRESPFLHTYHEISLAEDYYVTNDDISENYATEGELYTKTLYYVRDQEVSLDTYYAEFDSFSQLYVRIPETELKFFYWSAVSNEDDDYAARGEKMAQALISSGQEFAVPDGNANQK